MSKKEFETKVLKLNGRMTKELFDKVINEVLLKGDLDQEKLWYFKEQYNISLSEFNDICHYLDKKYESYIINSGDDFPEYLLYFKYQNNYFCLRLVIGQGSCFQLFLVDYGKEIQYVEIKDIDTKIKFYKDFKEF